MWLGIHNMYGFLLLRIGHLKRDRQEIMATRLIEAPRETPQEDTKQIDNHGSHAQEQQCYQQSLV